jgi:hypothetical protein
MPNIEELNLRRAETALTLQMLGMVNQPIDHAERLKLDARYRLAKDANYRAEQDYSAALAALSTEDLIALTK